MNGFASSYAPIAERMGTAILEGDWETVRDVLQKYPVSVATQRGALRVTLPPNSHRESIHMLAAAIRCYLQDPSADCLARRSIVRLLTHFFRPRAPIYEECDGLILDVWRSEGTTTDPCLTVSLCIRTFDNVPRPSMDLRVAEVWRLLARNGYAITDSGRTAMVRLCLQKTLVPRALTQIGAELPDNALFLLLETNAFCELAPAELEQVLRLDGRLRLVDEQHVLSALMRCLLRWTTVRLDDNTLCDCVEALFRYNEDEMLSERTFGTLEELCRQVANKAYSTAPADAFFRLLTGQNHSWNQTAFRIILVWLLRAYIFLHERRCMRQQRLANVILQSSANRVLDTLGHQVVQMQIVDEWLRPPEVPNDLWELMAGLRHAARLRLPKRGADRPSIARI